MARKTVKIEIPIDNEDEMLHLAKAVIKKEETPSGLLKKYDMKDFGEKTTQGEAHKIEQRRLNKLSQEEGKEASLRIGSAEGQSVKTKGTLYNYLTRMRDTLLEEFEDNEEKLGEWGFKVVTGEAKSPTRKPKG